MADTGLLEKEQDIIRREAALAEKERQAKADVGKETGMVARLMEEVHKYLDESGDGPKRRRAEQLLSADDATKKLVDAASAANTAGIDLYAQGKHKEAADFYAKLASDEPKMYAAAMFMLEVQAEAEDNARSLANAA